MRKDLSRRAPVPGAAVASVRRHPLLTSLFPPRRFSPARIFAYSKPLEKRENQPLELRDPAHLSVDLSPVKISGCEVSAFSAPLQNPNDGAVIDLWSKPEEERPKPWDHWKFEITDENKRLRILKDRFYIIRSREKIHLPQGIAVYCRASDETIGEMRIHYAGFVHPFFGKERDDQGRGTPLIFEVRGHDIDVSLMNHEKMARLEFYRMSEDAQKETNRGKSDLYASQSLQLSKFFGSWPKEATRAADGTVTPK